METANAIGVRYDMLKLGNNLVDEAGCRDLGKAPWPLLCEINLSNIFIIEGITV